MEQEAHKRRGRPKKERPGILSDEQAEALKTPEQRASEEQELIRTQNLERKRKQRAREAAQRAQERTAEHCDNREDWFASQRALLPADELAALQEQDAYLNDVLFSMKTVQNVRESDPELIDIVTGLVKDLGTCHLGNITKDPDIPCMAIHRRPYWKNRELLDRLIAEGPQTAVYATYGYLNALPDYRVVEFLHKRANWEWDRAAALVNYKIDLDGHVTHVTHGIDATKATTPTATEEEAI
jgi:hypothetical protein